MGAKGKPKTGGRKPGSLNKRTNVWQELEAQCEAKGINVWEKALEYLIYPCDPGLRLQAIKELMKYLYPQRREIDHLVSGNVDITRRLETADNNLLDVIIVENEDDQK